MKKIVYVTGVAGFLGSHLARYHLDQGDEVHGCDTFFSSDENSTHLVDLKNRGLRFSRFDIRLNDHFMYLRPDVIYNMACVASPPLYQSMPVETLTTSVMGTYNVLSAARACGSRVVHASTSEVYGDPSENEQMETAPGRVWAWGPRSCYDSGKMAAEALCHDMRSHVDVRVARIFNTYGPNMRMDDGRVVTNFVKQALKNEDMTIYGGDQTRSLCYVDDLVSGLVLLGECDQEVTHPVNLGNPETVTMKELAEKIRNLVPDSKSVITYQSIPKHDPKQRRPNIRRAKTLLGWEPTISLDEGLKMFINYARTRVV